MGEVIQFRRPRPGKNTRGKTLCREGFHKWEVWQRTPFDVKEGKLITVYKCVRCGEMRSETR